ncbi:hypothetical protein NC651_000408 [Populus alba x Populus x berolinensis]|nr:hypothetical protein NC651_000408 [Populus alba x Populus x berolinensis]
MQQRQMNCFESQFYPFPSETQFQCAPFSMFSQGYPFEIQFQDFQYFVVIDFEATCDQERNPHPQEIIEFPSVIVSSVTGQLEACFQTYVRPTCNQLLCDFCKDLDWYPANPVGFDSMSKTKQSVVSTLSAARRSLLFHLKWILKHFIVLEKSNEAHKVDRGVTLSEALLRHDKWLENKG